MKTYSLGTPPTSAGVYMLTNKRTGQIYVGQTVGLRRRYNEWKAGLASGFGHVNVAMHEAFSMAPDLDEWVFVVVKEMPGAPTKDLLTAEDQTIKDFDQKRPGLVLNTLVKKEGSNAVLSPAGGVALITDEGVMVGVGKAAIILGRREDTIRTKVRWLKAKGVTRVNVSDLTMDRRHILQKIKNEQTA